MTLFETYRRAMMAKPEQSRKEALTRFRSDVTNDPDLIESLINDYFERQVNRWFPRRTALGYVFGRAQNALDRQKSKVLTVSERESMKARLRKIILMDLELPNGKTLRYATGAECAKAGGFYAEIARHIKPTEVVDKHLTENDLQNIRSRTFQVNAA